MSLVYLYTFCLSIFNINVGFYINFTRNLKYIQNEGYVGGTTSRFRETVSTVENGSQNGNL